MTITPSENNYREYCKITDRYKKQLNNIWKDTVMFSHHENTIKHPDFISLVEEGAKIIPWLIHDGVSQGFDWTHLLLLGRITEERPWPETACGKFTEQVGYWILWYTKNSHKFNDDIYNGLVTNDKSD